MISRRSYKSRRGMKRTRKTVKSYTKRRSYRTRKHYSKNKGSYIISKFVNYRKPSAAVKAMKRISASDLLYNSYLTRVESSIGYCTATAASMLGGGAYTGTAGGFDADMAQLLYRINGGTSGNDVKKTTRFCVENVKADFKFTNQDNGPVEVQIFDVIAKRDNNYSPQEAFRSGLANQAATAFTLATMPPGLQPTMSLQFNNYFKILQRKTVILGQGKTHNHIISLSPNRIFNGELLKQSNLNIAGLTHWVMIIVTGQVSNSITNPDTEVSFGAAAIDISLTKTIRYTWTQDLTASLFINTNPATAFTGGESVFNVGTGAPGPEAQA